MTGERYDTYEDNDEEHPQQPSVDSLQCAARGPRTGLDRQHGAGIGRGQSLALSQHAVGSRYKHDAIRAGCIGATVYTGPRFCG